MTKKSPAAFLDRDGVLNTCSDPAKKYVHTWADFQWITGSRLAIRLLKDAGYKVFVITNQGGVAFGYYTEQDIEDIHGRMQNDLAILRTSIDAFYHCPHHPQGSNWDYRLSCPCRKPQPGMIMRAIHEFNIDPAKSFLVGDMETDIQAGMAAKLGDSYLIKEDTRHNSLLHIVQTRLGLVDEYLTAKIADPNWDLNQPLKGVS